MKKSYESVLSKKMQRAILKSSVVSFDIFDTLLVRPYLKPTDLFLHIEKHYNRSFFKDARISAEWAARKKTTAPDVTLDEIYDQIDDNFKDLKQIELNWEGMVLRTNPQMKDIYDFALKNGKRIVIASDMYLPSEFIANVLHENGYKGYEKLYVSGELCATKCDGAMFDLIIKDMGVKPKQILHIGDNHDSDYKKPREHGLCAIHYPGIMSYFMKNNERITRFCEKTKNDLGASIFISMLAYRNLLDKNDNYWYNLGYEYGGPVIYGYTRWIERVSQKEGINNLMFVARDGYTLQRVFNTFNKDIKNSYVYAPRFLNLICRLDYKQGDSNVALAQQNTIIEYYKNHKEINKEYFTYDFKQKTKEQFIKDNFISLKKLADKNFKVYKNYLSIYQKPNDKIGIIDTITENFSAQNLIISCLNKKNISATGFYWYVIYPSVNKYVSFFNTSNDSSLYIKNWGLMEFLMTSPEYPVEGVSEDFKPIYKKDISTQEKHIREIYPCISEGSVGFAKDVKTLFNNKDIYLNYDTIVHWVNCFCDIPYKKDFIYIGNIQTSSNPNNDVYESLFRSKIKFFYKIKHPFIYYKKIKKFLWLTPFEHFIISIMHPIKIHIRGLKNISLYILPKAKHHIFNMNINIFNKIIFQIVIGAKDEI